MIDLSKTTGPVASPDELIKDVTDATFMQNVIEASQTTPVIVDFWAPWCGPCRQIGPELEKAVTAAGGAVKMAKINIDENQMVAGQLQVQSIPAVFAFVGGQPVDRFVGALPGSQIREFVAKLTARSGAETENDGIDTALDAADQMLNEGAVADAAQTYAEILGKNAGNVRAIAGLARAYAAIGKTDNANAVLDGAPADVADDPVIAAARSAVQLAAAAADAGEADELRARVDTDPADHAARFELANALLAAGDHDGAVEELLELFRRDREWNNDAARTQLMKLFDSFGPSDPATLRGRRRLSSLIFA